MSLFQKGDCVIDQHGERLIVVDEPSFCVEKGQWEYLLIPDSMFSTSRYESQLTPNKDVGSLFKIKNAASQSKQKLQAHMIDSNRVNASNN